MTLLTTNKPNTARAAKNPCLFFTVACTMATTDQRVIRVGIQRSGPIFLETSCDGSSAARNVTVKMVLARLKSNESG